MNKLKYSFKNQDLFGHEIKLNLNGGGDTHKTYVGGCASIVIKVAMGIYIYLSFLKLLLNLDDKNSTVSRLLDLD